jgi:uncharacterized protein YbjT (DUF2867 family)
MNTPNAHILVIGATGFLGGRVVDALLERSKRVRALVQLGSDATALEAKGVAIVRGDMLDPSSLTSVFEGIDSRSRQLSVMRVGGEGMAHVPILKATETS